LYTEQILKRGEFVARRASAVAVKPCPLNSLAGAKFLLGIPSKFRSAANPGPSHDRIMMAVFFASVAGRDLNAL
jgi:hypothetical protein